MGRGCGGEPVVTAASSGWQKQGRGAAVDLMCVGDARQSGSSPTSSAAQDVLACSLHRGLKLEHRTSGPPAKSVHFDGRGSLFPFHSVVSHPLLIKDGVRTHKHTAGCRCKQRCIFCEPFFSSTNRNGGAPRGNCSFSLCSFWRRRARCCTQRRKLLLLLLSYVVSVYAPATALLLMLLQLLAVGCTAICIAALVPALHSNCRDLSNPCVPPPAGGSPSLTSFAAAAPPRAAPRQREPTVTLDNHEF